MTKTENKNHLLKKIMTELAAGHITQKEVDDMLTESKESVNKKKVSGRRQTSNTQKRKLNAKEVK